MAELGEPTLEFDVEPGFEDPGRRKASLPEALPSVPNDFDWMLRDFESFRLFMWEEMKARFPERTRWTAADTEAVLIEVLAAKLDHLSDMADRVHAECTLETARQPESVYGWLRFIGYDPLKERQTDLKTLLALYASRPHEMECDRRAGPGSLHCQRRMATLNDYSIQLAKHPLVRRAQAREQWSGAWPVVWVTVGLWNDLELEKKIEEKTLPKGRRDEIEEFHRELEIRVPNWASEPTPRELLRDYVSRFRMLGQEVCIHDVKRVSIVLDIRVHLSKGYFQSEVRRVLQEVLGRGPNGFFAPGRLRFGEDLHLSDLYELLMPLDGVENVGVLRLGRETDQSTLREVQHVVSITEDEVAGPLVLALELEGGQPG